VEPKVFVNQPIAPRNHLAFTAGHCGGLVNMRIALVQGFLIGMIMRRTIELPFLSSLGTQDANHDFRQVAGGSLVAFEAFYDAKKLSQAMEGSAHFTTNRAKRSNPSKSMVAVNRKGYPWHWFEKLGKDTAGVDRVQLDCPLFSLDTTRPPQVTEMFWRLNAALDFSTNISLPAQMMIKKLHSLSNNSQGYIALHARVEPDWVQYCKLMGALDGKVQGQACMGNLQQLPAMLATRGVPTSMPIYVATGYRFEELQGVASLQPLLKSKYRVFTKDTLLPDFRQIQPSGPFGDSDQRELDAAADYMVCEASSTFIGNSASSFSSLIMHAAASRFSSNSVSPADRRRRQKTSFYYNGDRVPFNLPQAVRRRLLLRE
jgi:hypothetical protein